MIKVNKYEVQTVEHFDNNGNSLGFLNEHESTYLRCQIAEEKVSGYFLVLNDLRIPIEPNGKLNEWPNGLYDTQMSLFSRLFKVDFDDEFI